MQPQANALRETQWAKLVRLFDEWGITIIIVLFGMCCFMMGALVGLAIVAVIL